MQETKRISKLLGDIYNGSPWIDVNLMEVLNRIPAAKAAGKPMPGLNSVWEITNHIISWRKNVLRRVNNEVIQSPADNYFSPVKDMSEKAWQETLEKLAASQEEWEDFLQQFDEADFEKIYPVNGMNYYEHIHGIIQHDAYHLGQIVLLAKIK